MSNQSNVVPNLLKHAFGSTVNQWALRLANKGNKKSRYLRDLFNMYFTALDKYTTNSLTQEEYNYYYGLTATLIDDLKWLLKFKAGNFAGVFPHTNARFNIKIDENDIRVFETDLRGLEDRFITKQELSRLKNAPPPINARTQAYTNTRTKYERDTANLGRRIKELKADPFYSIYYNEKGNRISPNKTSINYATGPFLIMNNTPQRNKANKIKEEINVLDKRLNTTQKAINKLKVNYETRSEAISAGANIRANGGNGGAGGASRFGGGTRKKRRPQ